MARGDKREAILRAAERAFSGRQVHEVTLDAVAEDARVGKGTIYLYFRSKDDLFFQLVTERLAQMERSVRELAALSTPARERLAAMAREMSASFRRHHAPLLRMQGPGPMRKQPGAREQFRGHHARIEEIVRRVIEEGVRGGDFRPGLDTMAAACAFMGVVRGGDWRYMEMGEDVGMDSLVDVFLNGVTVRPGPAVQ